MGLQPLEELLAERDVLVKKVSILRAKHGAFGTYDALRKIELAQIAQIIRAQAVMEPRKMTAAEIDDAAHSDGRYITFVTQATTERAQWAILENQIQGIADTIMRGQAVARFIAAEAHL